MGTDKGDDPPAQIAGILFEPEAREEAEDAFDYYDQISAAYGDRFLNELDRTLSRIMEFPRMHVTIEDSRLRHEIRRALVASFPYAVVYVPQNNLARVLAVTRLSREPLYWLRRAGDTD